MRVRARRNRIVVGAIAFAIALAAVFGLVAPATAAPLPAPRIGSPSLTVDCASLGDGHYSAMTVNASFSQLQPGAAYTLYNRHLGVNQPSDDFVPIVADAQGAASIDARLTGTFVASDSYNLELTPDSGTGPGASASLTSSACDSGVTAVGTPTIGFTCADRYWTAAGVNGTSFHVVASLGGFVPGTTYDLAVPGVTYRQHSAVASVDGRLAFDVTLSNSSMSAQVPTGWSIGTSSQGQPVASGTAATGECPPITKSTKRAALTHDGDVTGDGYGDLMAVDWDGRLWLYTNGIRSNPNHLPFSSGRIIGYGWLNNGPIQVVQQGDLTGDGYTDVVAIRSDGALVAYYNNINSNAGRMPYSAATVIGSGWLPFMRFAVTDVNGDGYADIVATKSDGSTYYYQNRFATDPLHRPFISGSPIAGAPFNSEGDLGGGDINGDGYGDVVLNGLWVNPSRVPAGSPAQYTGFYTGTDPNKITYNVTDLYAGWSAGDYEGRGSAGLVYASPSNDGRLIYVKDPGVSSNGTVIGSGWQTFAWLVH